MADIKKSTDYKRRAIYTALSEFMNGDDLLNAMCLWQEEYADAPRHANNKFVSQILNGTLLASKHAVVHLKITTVLLEKEPVLKPDPLTDMHDYLVRKKGREYADKVLNDAINSVVTTTTSDGAHKNVKAFELLVNEFINNIARTDKEHFSGLNVAMSNAAKTLNRDNDQLLELINWFEGLSLNIPDRIDTDTLRSVLNAGYIEACNKVGPVVADTALSDAVKKVEMDVSIKPFSPRDLL